MDSSRATGDEQSSSNFKKAKRTSGEPVIVIEDTCDSSDLVGHRPGSQVYDHLSAEEISQRQSSTTQKTQETKTVEVIVVEDTQDGINSAAAGRQDTSRRDDARLCARAAVPERVAKRKPPGVDNGGALLHLSSLDSRSHSSVQARTSALVHDAGGNVDSTRQHDSHPLPPKSSGETDPGSPPTKRPRISVSVFNNGNSKF